MNTHIPTGYQLQIHSWENDLDSKKINTFNGLTKEDVCFYIELLQLFRSRNAYERKGWGNGSIDMNMFSYQLEQLLKRHTDISKDTRELWTLENIDTDEYDQFEDDEIKFESLYDNIVDLIGYPECAAYSDMEYFSRVFDKVDVYLIESPLWNVTKDFDVNQK